MYAGRYGCAIQLPAVQGCLRAAFSSPNARNNQPRL